VSTAGVVGTLAVDATTVLLGDVVVGRAVDGEAVVGVVASPPDEQAAVAEASTATVQRASERAARDVTRTR